MDFAAILILITINTTGEFLYIVEPDREVSMEHAFQVLTPSGIPGMILRLGYPASLFVDNGRTDVHHYHGVERQQLGARLGLVSNKLQPDSLTAIEIAGVQIWAVPVELFSESMDRILQQSTYQLTS